MEAHEIERRLMESARAEWDGNRAYLGMSRLSTCPRSLFFEIKEGQRRPDIAGMLRCHEGYVHERDVLTRLEELVGRGLGCRGGGNCCYGGLANPRASGRDYGYKKYGGWTQVIHRGG